MIRAYLLVLVVLLPTLVCFARHLLCGLSPSSLGEPIGRVVVMLALAFAALALGGGYLRYRTQRQLLAKALAWKFHDRSVLDLPPPPSSKGAGHAH